MLGELKLLEEKAKTGDDEAEAHKGQTGANPCEESALGGQVIVKASALGHFHWNIHFLSKTSLHLLYKNGASKRFTRLDDLFLPLGPCNFLTPSG